MRFTYQSAWLPVISLAVAAFTFSTSEFMPVGLLSDISQSFHSPVADAGLLMTIYAWTVSLTSLPCMLLTRKIDRRVMVLRAFILFIAGQLLCTIAWNFAVLVIARMAVAIAHAIFWAITASIAMRIAPANGQTKALSLLVMGTSLAAILGLPCGRILGELFNWRIAFLAIGLLALGCFILLWCQLPALASQNSGSLHSLPVLFKKPNLLLMYWLMLVLTAGHFCAYGYIEPFIRSVAHGGNHLITAVLFIFGFAGIIASSLFSKLNRYPFMLLAGSMLAQAMATGLLFAFSASAEMLLILSLIWSMANTWSALALQLNVLKIAHEAVDVATSLYSTIYNTGVGIGTLVGGQVVLTRGISHIGEVAALMAFIGLGCYYVSQTRLFFHSARIRHKLP